MLSLWNNADDELPRPLNMSTIIKVGCHIPNSLGIVPFGMDQEQSISNLKIRNNYQHTF